MVCAEWWAAEVIALAAGFIGDNDLAAQSIVSTINSMVFMIPLGISVAVNTRVGNLLGGGHPERGLLFFIFPRLLPLSRALIGASAKTAKKSAGIAIVINLLSSALNLVFLIGLRNVWGYLLTNDEEVADLVGDLLRIYAVAQIFDGTQGVRALPPYPLLRSFLIFDGWISLSPFLAAARLREESSGAWASRLLGAF